MQISRLFVALRVKSGIPYQGQVNKLIKLFDFPPFGNFFAILKDFF